MRIILVNIPHPAIGSRIPDDHLPPLGLLAIGGPLIDAGHDVTLIDAEFDNPTPEALAAQVIRSMPGMVMFGHSGSTSGHPVIRDVAQRIAIAKPEIAIVYGGVYPSYHWREVLESEPYVTAIVRGEGEATTPLLVAAIEAGAPLDAVRGIAFRKDRAVIGTLPAEMISDLDQHRIGWELIDHKRYSYWGGRRAVVMQFSRGCPHPCTYCGQRGFWTKWRHRDPVLFAKEIARLYRERGVTFINLADENPTSSRKAWKAFLEALIEENVPVEIAGSTRADDIVRDADILHLYRKAGVIRWLMGMENTDEATLKRIRKGGSTSTDREAITLLRKHGIVSMATWVVGFGDDRHADLWRGLRQLLTYDPDQIQMLYATPHRWTPYFREVQDREIIQTDQRRWDYKHHVLKTRFIAPWVLLIWFKSIECILQARPKALRRVLFHPDPAFRHAMRWYTKMGRRVWFHEVGGFIFRDKRIKNGPTVAGFWGAPQDAEENALAPAMRGTSAPKRALPPIRTVNAGGLPDQADPCISPASPAAGG
jgi:anaerobic magnesium-protoporphyrin IX monomethyl ester cyclase